MPASLHPSSVQSVDEAAALKARVGDLERTGTAARLAALEAENVALKARVTTLETAAVRP